MRENRTLRSKLRGPETRRWLPDYFAPMRTAYQPHGDCDCTVHIFCDVGTAFNPKSTVFDTGTGEPSWDLVENANYRSFAPIS